MVSGRSPPASRGCTRGGEADCGIVARDECRRRYKRVVGRGDTGKTRALARRRGRSRRAQQDAAQDREIGSVKGDWKGWNFQLLGAGGEELGRVTKKWAGLGKELFTNADTYVISIAPAASGRREIAQLLLAAGLAIDTVFKEKDE